MAIGCRFDRVAGALEMKNILTALTYADNTMEQAPNANL